MEGPRSCLDPHKQFLAGPDPQGVYMCVSLRADPYAALPAGHRERGPPVQTRLVDLTVMADAPTSADVCLTYPQPLTFIITIHGAVSALVYYSHRTISNLESDTVGAYRNAWLSPGPARVAGRPRSSPGYLWAHFRVDTLFSQCYPPHFEV